MVLCLLAATITATTTPDPETARRIASAGDVRRGEGGGVGGFGLIVVGRGELAEPVVLAKTLYECLHP